MTFAPVGLPSFQTAGQFTIDPVAVGDIMIAHLVAESTTQWLTGLGSPNVNWNILVAPTVVGSNYITVLIGTVTNALPMTTQVFASSGSPTQRISIQEFSTTAGPGNVLADVAGTVNAVTTTFPSLTPGHGAGELYVGYGPETGSDIVGSTPGFAYFVDPNGNGFCYNASCPNSAQAPVWGANNQREVLAVLLYETPQTFDQPPVEPAFVSQGAHNDVRTEMNLGTLGWTDITAFVQETGDLVTGRGRPDESTTSVPTTQTLVLNNADGRFSDSNPTGPYYGKIGRNTPLRVSVPEGASYVRFRDDTSSWVQGPAGTAPGTNGFDAQIDVTLDNWRPYNGAQLMGKWQGSPNNSWALLMNDFGSLTFIVSTTGSNTITGFSQVPIPVPAGRRALIRATWNPANGGMDLYVGSGSLASPQWTHLDGFAGTTGPIFNATSTVWILGNINNQQFGQPAIGGKLHAAKFINNGLPLRSQNSSLFTSASNGGAVTWGTNPAAGSKVLVAVWTAAAETITSLVDNGTTPTTFTADLGPVLTTGGRKLTIFRGDNITLPATGSYAVTITATGGAAVVAGGCAYTGVAAGPPIPNGTNTAFGTSSVTAVAAGATGVATGGPILSFDAFVCDATVTETISGAGGGFSNQFTELSGATLPVGAIADNMQNGNSFNNTYAASWTLGTASTWVSASVSYGAGGTVVASPDFTVQAPGTNNFNDAQSNNWGVHQTAVITNRHFRFWGESAAFPTSWNVRGTDVEIALQAGGLMRRLSQSASQQPLNSVLRREWGGLPSLQQGGLAGVPANPLNNLVAYWPCEDGNSQGFSFATTTIPLSFAPGIPNIPNGTYQGQPNFAQNSNFQASLALPSINQSTWNFPLPMNRANDSTNYVRFLVQVPQGGETAFASGTNTPIPIVELHTTGTIARLQFFAEWQSGSQFPGFGIRGYNAAGSQLFSTGAATLDIRGWAFWISLELQQVGTNVQYALLTQLLGAPPTTYVNIASLATVAGTIGNGTVIIVDPGANLTETTVGHITYQNGASNQDMSGGEYTLPVNAYIGELAGNRFIRLCNEQAIPVRVRGQMSDTQPMGAQTPTDIISLLQECVDADRGMFWEPPWLGALGYIALNSLLNQPVSLTIPYGSSQLAAAGMAQMTANEDDQFTVNNAVVVNTYTGGQAVAAVTSGPLSINSPPSGVGIYEQQPQINLANDWQTGDEAGWITWVGTAPDLRFPAIPFHVQRMATPANFTALQELDLGDRIQILTTPPPPANTLNPVWLPPNSETAYARGGVDVLVNHADTTLNVKRYDIAITGVPTTPYLVAMTDDPVHGRCDTAGSQIAAAVSSSATSLSVVSNFTAWTTSAGAFPFDIIMGGEMITVTAIGAAGFLQTDGTGFEDGGIDEYSASNGTIANSTAQAHSGTRSLAWTIGASASSPVLVSNDNPPNVALSPVVGNASYTCTVWVFSATVPPTGFRIFINWFDVNGNFVSNSVGTTSTIVANTWTQFTATFTTPASAFGARFGIQDVGSPTNGTVVFIDDTTFGPAAAQAFTVIRSQNGVVKAQPALASLALYTTPAASL